MFGRTVLAATALTASALTVPATVPHAHAAAQRVVKLSNADNGRTVFATLGEKVEVNLKATSGNGVKWVWDVPVTSAPHVLRRVSGGTAPSGDARATFRAEELGRSTIIAPSRCVVTAPGHICPHLGVLWRTTVDVF